MRDRITFFSLYRNEKLCFGKTTGFFGRKQFVYVVYPHRRAESVSVVADVTAAAFLWRTRGRTNKYCYMDETGADRIGYCHMFKMEFDEKGIGT